MLYWRCCLRYVYKILYTCNYILSHFKITLKVKIMNLSFKCQEHDIRNQTSDRRIEAGSYELPSRNMKQKQSHTRWFNIPFYPFGIKTISSRSPIKTSLKLSNYSFYSFVYLSNLSTDTAA